MKEKLSKFLGCCLFAVTLCLLTPSLTKAAVKNIPQQKNSNSFAANVDMNGDKKADSIVIKASKEKENSYVSQYTIYMNKKAVTAVNLSDFYCNYFTVKYVKMSNSREFLQIIGHGDNDYIVYNELLAYSKKTKQFYTVNSFHESNIYATEIISANKNGLVIRHSDQPAETGWLFWTLPYKYQKGKFVPTTTSTNTVKSGIAGSRKDKYSKYFAKNKFVAAKKLTFYNGNKVAFRVNKGKVVTLTKLSLSKNKIYLQFQYGKKKGWIRVNHPNYDSAHPLFQSVNSRLVA